MDQQVKHLLHKRLKINSQDPWWEESTESLKFFHDPHMPIMPFVYLNSHTSYTECNNNNNNVNKI